MNRGYEFSTGSMAHIKTLAKPLQNICHNGMKIANTRRMFCPDFSIVRGLTTAEAQFELYKKGRFLNGAGKWEISDRSQVVTYCDGTNRVSDHQHTDIFGGVFAFDFACWIDGRSNYEDHNMALVATCFLMAASDEGFVVNWGGNYRSISDGSHISLVV